MSAMPLAMRSAQGASLLLEKVDVRGSIHSTLARITMRQAYRNDTHRNVEAIYTFPLPPTAVLLRTVVEIGGKRYEGVVLPKARAEAEYEDAVAQGNTAIMVERPEPGVYTMNVGNLMAGESATVEIEFAQLLDWSHGRMRLALPMTLAPRYGEERGRLEPQARPNIDPALERGFSLQLTVAVRGSVSSPSHSISTGLTERNLVVLLNQKSAWMDRDFILMVKAAAAPEPFAMTAADGDSRVGYVSFQIPESGEAAGGRDVRIVVDCSGSMNGDSIALARAGTLNLLNRLRESDRFGLVAFGSTARAFKSTMAPATDANVERAVEWAQGLAADMGGTELATALESAMDMRGPRGPGDIFLVTDGQVGESEKTLARARQLGHRVFVVAIGVSPSRGLLEELAEITGGAIDYISPGEDVAEAIGRQFARATQAPIEDVSVDWGALAAGASPSGIPAGPAYSGDTIHAFCDVGAEPRSLQVSYRSGGQRVAFEVPCAPAPQELESGIVPRLAASQRIREWLRSKDCDRASAEALAVKHQLVTELTNYVLVVDRGDAKAADFPKTVPVPTMLAAGWGGAGQALSTRFAVDAMAMSSTVDLLDLGEASLAFARKAPQFDPESPAGFIEVSNERFGSLLSTRVLPLSLSSVTGMRLPSSIGEFLQGLIDSGRPEEEVMRAFWAAFALFLDPAATKRGLARKLKAVARSADGELVGRILAELRALEAHT